MVEHVASLSDHCGVVFEIVLQNVSNPFVKKTSHETYWKLNASILKDEDFLHNFVDLWSWLKLEQKSFSDIADWWDLEVKPKVKEFCIQFSKDRNVRRNDSKKFWLAFLKIALVKKDWHEVIRVKGKLHDMLQEDAFGYVVRCRFRNNASEEVASLFHANKEVKNANKNKIKSLKINGIVTDDPKKI